MVVFKLVAHVGDVVVPTAGFAIAVIFVPDVDIVFF
jgi:hypothetical protein